ncbi:MAG: immune inhibitor A [Caldilineaceae bacterium]
MWLLPILLLVLMAGAACAGVAQPGTRPLERRQPPAPAAQSNAATEPVPGERLADLKTLDQYALLEPPQRDLRDLALRLNPDSGEIPLTVPARIHRIGDQEPFWVRNTSTNRAIEITATLVYSTPVAYVWVENGQEYDQAAIERSIDRFSSVTYPDVVNTFGSEWHPGVDNDPRLHILYNTQMGTGVVGYFSGSDEYVRPAAPFSNQKEMFYINLGALNSTHNFTFHDTTLAHEFQHMIHWYMDRGEDLWVNEGLSEYAQDVAEFGGSTMFVTGFAADPDLQLTTWRPVGGNNGPHYGSAYLFMAYLAQRFGRAAITDLVAAPANGMHGVDAALNNVGAGVDSMQLFADWVVANYADQPDALGEKGRYGYENLELPKFQLAGRHAQYPVAPQAATVSNFATDYIELAGDGDVTFSFQGDTETHLADAGLPDADRTWWSNRADESASRLTRKYDLSAIAPGTPLTLTASMWWDIETDYDFGYVMASRDGKHWQILPGKHTAKDNPSGNAFGPGYTGISGDDPDQTPQWVDEQIDLSAYAGGPLWLQFSYITDDAVNLSGWMVDNALLVGPNGPLSPVLTGNEPGEDEAAGWESEGWLFTDNRLPQTWLVQAMEFDGDTLTAVRRVPVAADGHAEVDIKGLGNGRRAVVAISGLAPVTTLPASYEYSIVAK